jgi:hypothetical protein
LRATGDGVVDLAAGLTIEGSLGVGTASPGAKLEVAGGGGSSVDLVVNGRMRSDNDDGGLWVGQDRFVGGLDTSKIGFWNGNSWRLAVQSDGKVGIGTTQPAATLHVDTAPSPSPVTALQVDVGSFISMDNARASYFLSVRDVAAAATHFCIRGDGTVGVGTASPRAKLEVAGGGGSSVDLLVNGRLRSDNNDGGLWVMEDRFVGGYGTGNIGFWNNGQWRLTVLTNGTVGIGTGDTGGQTLCVAGPTWVQRDLFIGGKLTQQTSPGQWSQISGIGVPGLLGASALAWEPAAGPSDVRLKTDLRPVGHALELVRKLQAVRYRWGEDGLGYFTRDIEESVSAGPGATGEQHRQARQGARDRALEALAGDRLGLVAQDVESVLPELVHHDADGYKHIRYQHLTAVLAEAIKEQDATVRALSAEVAALRAEGARS